MNLSPSCLSRPCGSLDLLQRLLFSYFYTSVDAECKQSWPVSPQWREEGLSPIPKGRGCDAGLPPLGSSLFPGDAAFEKLEFLVRQRQIKGMLSSALS